MTSTATAQLKNLLCNLEALTHLEMVDCGLTSTLSLSAFQENLFDVFILSNSIYNMVNTPLSQGDIY